MEPVISTHELDQLYAPFERDEYEVREGPTSGNNDKRRWWVYVRREAIQKRLERIFPGEWAGRIPPGMWQKHNEYTEVYYEITIRGITRGMIGSHRAAGRDNVHDDANESEGKAANTDGLKRAATMWGMGLELQNCPAIWTENDYKGDWKKKDQRTKEALNQFYKWRFNGDTGQQPTNSKSVYGKSNGNGSDTEAESNKAYQHIEAEFGYTPEQADSIRAQYEKRFEELRATGLNHPRAMYALAREYHQAQAAEVQS